MKNAFKSMLAGIVKVISDLLAVRKRPANRPEHEKGVVTSARQKELSSLPVIGGESGGRAISKQKTCRIKSCDEWLRGRRVVIDGTNVCFWGGRKGAGVSLSLLLALCADLHSRGVDYMVYFDASTRYVLKEKGEKGCAKLYSRLLKARPDRFHEVMAQATADEAVLMDVAEGPANEKPTVVITRDLYRDHVGVFPFASDANLRLMGVVQRNGVWFGKIGWFVPYKKVA